MFFNAPTAVLALAALSASPVHAFWRLSCDRTALVRERADPIVSPGTKSGHLHVIHGGSNFNLNVTFDSLRASSCTSCLIANDKSNYWTPTLWFQDPKTKKLEPVEGGGILIYYQQRGSNPDIKAFPAGFRMIAGDMTLRSKKYPEQEKSQGELRERALKWTCLRYTAGKDGYNGYGFPNTACESGFQARVHMPNCWDGKNLDSADHRSHVAYMSLLDNGHCPDTHPVPLISMFYEQTWSVDKFAGRYNVSATPWPFVWSHGDPTGYGYHADFVMGWDVKTLQSAITECDNQTEGTKAGKAEACPFFQMQESSVAKTCAIAPHVKETTTGVLDKLPGCNPIQAGPNDATIYKEDNCPI